MNKYAKQPRKKSKKKLENEMDKVKCSILLLKLKNNFHFWWTQFQSNKTVKKFEQATGNSPDPDMPVSEATAIPEGEDRDLQKTSKECIGNGKPHISISRS